MTCRHSQASSHLVFPNHAKHIATGSLISLLLYSGGTLGSGIADSLAQLYSGVRRVVEANRAKESTGRFTVMIDDVSLLEVAANGSADDVLDFLHYCVTLTSEMVKLGLSNTASTLCSYSRSLHPVSCLTRIARL